MPRSGRYTIEESERIVSISIDWQDREGQAHHIEFCGVPDGSDQPSEAPGFTHMTLTRVNSSTLDSTAYNGQTRTMYARRVAHGDLLSTLQQITTDDGYISNFQVYERVLVS